MSKEALTALVVSGTGDSGRALVRTIAEAGGTVGFTYNRAAETADELLEDLSGDSHTAWRCDVTDPEQVDSVVTGAFDTLDTIDAIIYTVGVISRAAVDETEPEDWQHHLDANVTGAFNVIRSAAPYLEEQGHGALVALSAADGVIRSEGLSAYDTSKRGLEAFIQEVARDLGPGGIRANVVAPGFIRDPEALSEEAKQDLLDQIPYKRLTTPQDVANACLYLCSDDAATVTGAVLPVDSGLSL